MPVNYIFTCTSFLPQLEISKYVNLSVTGCIRSCRQLPQVCELAGWALLRTDKHPTAVSTARAGGLHYRQPFQEVWLRRPQQEKKQQHHGVRAGREKRFLRQGGQSVWPGAWCAAPVCKPGDPALRLSSVVPARGTLHYRGPSSHPRCSYVITLIIIVSLYHLESPQCFSHTESPLPTMTLKRKLQPLLFY